MVDPTSKPVASDDLQAVVLAAIKRAESVPVIATVIDLMSDDEWDSQEPDLWNINAGSNKGNDEIDGLDSDVEHAA